MFFRFRNFFLAPACLSFFLTVFGPFLHAENNASAADGNHVTQRIVRPFERNTQNAASQREIPGSRVVLVDFYGDSCGPCRAMNPVIDRLRTQGFTIRKVNTAHEPAFAAEYRVSSIPCFVVLVDGKEHSRCVGATSESRLAEMMHAANKTLVASASASAASAEARAAQRGQQPARSAWRGKETPFTVEEIADNRWNPPQGLPSDSPRAEIIPVSHTATTTAYESATVPAETAVMNTDTTFPLRSITGSAGGGEITPIPSVQRKDPGTATKNPSHAHLLASTVRINIAGGWRGSGTIIDCRNGHALILTCGHLFREYRRGDKILVDLFGENCQQGVEAKYLAHEYDTRVGRDLAIISIPVTAAVQVSALAPQDFPLRKGMGVTTAGCSEGNLPTIQTAVVTGVNRVMPIPILKVSTQSIEGRSGGGYFASQTGELIGVCIAADPENNEGLSIPAETIHDFLNRCKLSQYVCNPCNDSVQLAEKQDPRNRMALTMPESEPVIQLTTLPLAEGKSQTRTASTPSVSTAAPSVPSSPRSLTGAPLPTWPPRW